MDKARLEALIAEAVTHCYDDEEAFWGLFCALQINVPLPLKATVGGKEVTMVALDEPSSGLKQGAMARVEGGDKELVPLSDLEPPNADQAGAEWIAAYRHWIGQR